MSCLHSVIGAMTGVVTVWEMRSAMQTYEIDDETVWEMRSVTWIAVMTGVETV